MILSEQPQNYEIERFNFLKIFIAIFIFFTLGEEAAFAATAKGNADVYKVTMRKIELCTGYTVVDLPNSFGFIRKHNGLDEDGNDLYKYGKSHWFNFKGLTWIEPPMQWQLLI